MRKLFATIGFFILVLIAAGQNGPGQVKIIQDVRVDTLLAKHKYINEINPEIEGWRIQIFFESGNFSKRLAVEAKSTFVEKYPEVPSYILFHEPYYKVRVGDYRTRMDAEKFLREIEKDYPNAFVVTDEINFPALD
jgi:hypothetical protein